jgi:hypothetical protein
MTVESVAAERELPHFPFCGVGESRFRSQNPSISWATITIHRASMTKQTEEITRAIPIAAAPVVSRQGCTAKLMGVISVIR